MRPMTEIDPFEALTVSEAASLAGVGVGKVRKAIQGGRLLHEVGRRGGREVQLVRRMDLAELWPDVLGEEEEPVLQPEAPMPPPAAQPAAREGHGHALEVRVAALQSANDALSGQVRDLQVQRTDLKEQATDLRGRMTILERERQAGTAGLLLAQRRLMELESGAVGPPRPWWRQRTTWGATSAVLLVGMVFTWQWRELQLESLARKKDVVDLVTHHAGERESFLSQSDRWRQESEDQLSAQARDRETFERVLEQTQGRADTLMAELDATLRQAEVARTRFAGQLEDALEVNATTQQALLEGRAAALADLSREREAAIGERQRFAAELDHREEVASHREDALRQELALARTATENVRADLARQLDQQSAREGERQDQLDAALERVSDLEVGIRQKEAWKALRGIAEAVLRR